MSTWYAPLGNQVIFFFFRMATALEDVEQIRGLLLGRTLAPYWLFFFGGLKAAKLTEGNPRHVRPRPPFGGGV